MFSQLSLLVEVITESLISIFYNEFEMHTLISDSNSENYFTRINIDIEWEHNGIFKLCLPFESKSLLWNRRIKAYGNLLLWHFLEVCNQNNLKLKCSVYVELRINIIYNYVFFNYKKKCLKNEWKLNSVYFLLITSVPKIQYF